LWRTYGKRRVKGGGDLPRKREGIWERKRSQKKVKYIGKTHHMRGEVISPKKGKDLKLGPNTRKVSGGFHAKRF